MKTQSTSYEDTIVWALLWWLMFILLIRRMGQEYCQEVENNLDYRDRCKPTRAIECDSTSDNKYKKTSLATEYVKLTLSSGFHPSPLVMAVKVTTIGSTD